MAFVCATGFAVAALWAVPGSADDWRRWNAPPSTEEWLSTVKPITLDPPGSVDTRPFAVTASGDVVGLYATADAKVHGFLLTRGVYTSIDIPGAIRTNAVGVNDLFPEMKDWKLSNWRQRLAVVGRYDVAAPTPANPNASIAHAYLLSDGVLTAIDHPEATDFTVATMITSTGKIVGRYRAADTRLHGFLLAPNGAFTTIDYPGATQMFGIGINARGDVLAGYYADSMNRSHGFVLRHGDFTTIDPPGSIATGGNGFIVGINSREVVGSYRTQAATLACGCDGTRAFVYSLRDGSYTTFTVPDSIGTTFTGINGRGDIVGTYVDAAGRIHGHLLRRGNDD